jgi:hypothetical protein
MAADIKEIKKKIGWEWQRALPYLSMYSLNKFYKIVGPAIIGLELIKLPRAEEYRPHFVVYSLCSNRMGTDLKACLTWPIILKEYKNKKGFQFDIPYDKHDNYFNEVLESIKQQTPLSFDGDISLKELFPVIDEYTKTLPNSYLRAALQGAKLEIALYISVWDAQKVLEQINKVVWDPNHFKMWGVDLNTWLEGLKKKVNNREQLLKQVTINKQDKKIIKLKNSELIA